MNYQRVLPRDLINEAALLRNVARLFRKLNGVANIEWLQFDPEAIVHDDDDDSVYLTDLVLRIGQSRHFLCCPAHNVESEEWPLFVWNFDDESVTYVFETDGELTTQFHALIGEKQ